MENPQNTYKVAIPDTNITFNNTHNGNNTVQMSLTADGNFVLTHNNEEKLRINKDGKFFVNGNEVDGITDANKVYEAFGNILFNCQLSFGFIKTDELSKYIYHSISMLQDFNSNDIKEIIGEFIERRNR